MLLLLNLPIYFIALKLYRIIRKDCSFNTGLIIQADIISVVLLTIEGKFLLIPRDQINNILIYNLADNPIKEIEQSEQLANMTYKIFVEGNDDYLFIGWAVRFVDDLVFFYDVQGKSFVLDIHKILKIQAVDETAIKDSVIENTDTFFKAGTSIMLEF